MPSFGKICAIAVLAVMLAVGSAYAGVVPQGEPGIGTGKLFQPLKVKTRFEAKGIRAAETLPEEVQPVEIETEEAEPGTGTAGMVVGTMPQTVQIMTCDEMAYLTEEEWPGLKTLPGSYPELPPGAYEKSIWDGEFNIQESVQLSIEDPEQFDGDPRYATIKVKRFTPGMHQGAGHREKLYGIEKKVGAQLNINCLLRITVKNVSPGMSPGANLTAAIPQQPCEGENCFLDLDVRYDPSGDPALYSIYTETSDYQPKDYMDLVRGNNAIWPYRMMLEGVTVKGCDWWGKYGGAFEQFENPGDTTSTYCGGYQGGAPGDEDFIAEISLTNMANQNTVELKFRQSNLSSLPVIDGSPIYFGGTYLAQSQAVAKLGGFGKIKKTGKLNKYGFFFFNTARGAYIRYYPQQPERIILRGFTWYKNPTDLDWGTGYPPPGFHKDSYVFFRGERIPISFHGWNTNFDTSEESKFVHNIYYNFWLDNKLNITFDYWEGTTFKIKSKWRVIAEVIPGPYVYPY